MYVCVCNAINDRQVRQAVASGLVRVGDIRRHLGFERRCGRCSEAIRAILDAQTGAAGCETPCGGNCPATANKYQE